MRRPILVTAAILLGIWSSVFAAPPGDSSATQPAVAGPEGRRAFDDLAAYYADPQKAPDVSAILTQLKSDDATVRQTAGRYLLAMFTQLEADDRYGLIEWFNLAMHGEYPDSPGRKLREHAAEEFAQATGLKDEAIDAALCLIEKDLVGKNETAGVQALCHVDGDSPRLKAALGGLLSPPHPNRAVAVAAIEEVGKRGWKDLAAKVAPLCTNYRQPIREAAIKQAAALGFIVPAYKPEEAFTPWLQGELRAVAGMVLTPIPAGATWQRFTVTQDADNKNDPPRVWQFSGWLLWQTPDTYHTLDLFAAEQDFPKAKTKLEPRALKQDAEEMLKIRTPDPANNGQDDHGRSGQLSRSGMLSGLFESPDVSAPEVVLSAWCLQRGDLSTAAMVIFPRYSEIPDQRWVRWIARDSIGWHYHDELLHAFCYDRDYPTAIKIAQHLSKSLFDDYRYQERAREMVQQLTARQAEDFKTLTLPTPDAWENQKKTLTRPQQVEFLAKRLRLLNWGQWGQSGGVNFSDEQFDRPMRNQRNPDDKDKPVLVINPYEELGKMKLEVKELPALVPFLADENFMLMYSYWREWHPDRTLHRANEAVAEIINDVAKRDLAQMKEYERLDAEGKKQHVAKVLQWVQANADKPRAQILMETIQTANDFWDVAASARELIRSKHAAALPIFIKRAGDFGEYKGAIVEWCYRLKPEGCLEQARQWSKDADRDTRFWAGMILLHSGDKAKGEGLDVLKPIFDKAEDDTYYAYAFDELLAGRQEQAVQLACAVLKKKETQDYRPYNLRGMVQRLLLAGRQEAIDYLLAELDSTQDEKTGLGVFADKWVEYKQYAGDRAGELIAELRTDKYEYPSLAPDDARAAERVKLKQWVHDQGELIHQGKPLAIKQEPLPMAAPSWQVDAP